MEDGGTRYNKRTPQKVEHILEKLGNNMDCGY